MRTIYRVLVRGRLICGEGRQPDSLWARRLPREVFLQLRETEGVREAKGESPVFTWGIRGGVEFAIVGPWVGVIEVGSTQIEILPKADQDDRPQRLDREAEAKAENLIQGNLLEMLSFAGRIPPRVRGQAAVSVRRGTLQDTLIRMFLERLVTEFRRGAPRTYTPHEEELGTVRGRLMVQQQIVRNGARPHRLWCRFDELELDPVLGGLFGAACRILQRRGLAAESRRLLAEAAGSLEEAPPLRDTAKVSFLFNRQNERFRDVFDFAQMIVSENAPEQRAGATRSFNLLYQMDRLFEAFIAGFVEREVMTLTEPTFAGWLLRTQARDARRFLMTRDDHSKRGVLQMRPDLVFERDGQFFIADTKWKCLEPGTAPTPSNADLYQMYTYLHEYGGRRVTLIYPCTEPDRPGTNLRLSRTEADGARWVSVRFANLGVDLTTTEGRSALARQLTGILSEGMNNTDALAGTPQSSKVA